jgi:rubrerythrin
MSIVQSLKKLVDPIRARDEAHELEKLREQPKRENAGDPPHYRCRICEAISTDAGYCPNCLADTMVLVKKGR